MTSHIQQLLGGDEDFEMDFNEDETSQLLAEENVKNDGVSPVMEVSEGTSSGDQNSDTKSIWVGNVEYTATAQQLEAHFKDCGSIVRLTIQCNKFTGHPKGFAYIEFADQSSAESALALDGSLFYGRNIQVLAKRSNRPGISSTDRFPIRQMLRRVPKVRFIPSYKPREVLRRPRGSGFRSRGIVDEVPTRNLGVQHFRFKPQRPRRFDIRRPF